MFQTFIPVQHEAVSLDIHKIMMSIVENKQMSLEEFWATPLSTVLEMIGMMVPPEKKPISRKSLIDRERAFNRRMAEKAA